ncbi:hypothetical protein P5673_008848 [Acropora cervicornis]|uniref:Uncharacterized protein n=1 Tax=Acropora cervicornis TaxID=6130 RepID=A0AAD9VAM3_ACRCE|nr:hypothetical protein P5673_008848 [Acropora cervicornis]
MAAVTSDYSRALWLNCPRSFGKAEMNSFFVTKREKILSKHFVDHFLPPYGKVTLIQALGEISIHCSSAQLSRTHRILLLPYRDVLDSSIVSSVSRHIYVMSSVKQIVDEPDYFVYFPLAFIISTKKQHVGRVSKKSVERIVDGLEATCNQKTKRRPGVNRLAAQDSLAYQILQRMPRSWNKNRLGGASKIDMVLQKFFIPSH